MIAELLRLPMVALVELGPLSAPALAEILSNGGNAPSPLSAATLNSLVERAEGNAYYAEELLTASSCADGTLPTGLAALLLSRVERVSDSAQQVLRAAAVAGGGADDDLVRAASGLPDDVYEEAVREAAGHQLLAFDEPGGYRFRHALLREAVYADLMPGERTRLHARIASLLAGVHGAAAALAHHSMASHDIPGAFAASVRAGTEAERLGAPAEAHRHYDMALELWLRVDAADQIAGMSRGKLGLKSALAAAASGDVPRAVHLLRRIRDRVSGKPAAAGPAESVELRCRVGERLAYHLLQSENKQWYAEALARGRGDRPGDAGRAADLVPGPRHGDLRDRADGGAPQRRRPGLGRPGPGGGPRRRLGLGRGGRARHERAARPPVRQLRRGDRHVHRRDRAGGRGRGGRRPAAGRLSAGRAAPGAGRARGGRGGRPRTGSDWAEAEGLGLAPFGLDLQHLHFQAHFADGCLDHAQELADGFPVRVTRRAEAICPRWRCSSTWRVATRWSPSGGPGWSRSGTTSSSRTSRAGSWPSMPCGRGTASEPWRRRKPRSTRTRGPPTPPPVIRVTAIALAARADRAARLRAIGDASGADAEAAAGAALLRVAREGARFPARPKAVLGPEGRGWLARCEAEYARLTGANSPDRWERVLAEFGPGYVYEIARTQWRLAEALVEAGRRDEATAVWSAARDTATRLRAAPLGAALDDLARRARLDHGTRGGHGRGPAAPARSPA